MIGYLRSRWIRPLLLILGIAMLALTLRSVNVRQIWGVLRELSLLDIVVLGLANALVMVVFTGRWWLFLRAQGHTVPYHNLIAYRLAAFGVSYFTPGPHLGGEPLQVYLVARRHAVPLDVAVAAVTMDKLFELSVNFAFLVTALLFALQHSVLPDGLGRQAVIYAGLLLALPLLLLWALWRGAHPLSTLVGWWQRRRPGDLLQRGQALLYRSEQAVTELCRRQPQVLAAALAVSTLSWVAIIGEYWLMTRLLGLDLSLDQAVLALVAARIAILLPMPAGLGALEASQVIALQLLGKSGAAGMTLALVIRARDVLLGLLGLWICGIGVLRVGGRLGGGVPHVSVAHDEPPPAPTHVVP